MAENKYLFKYIAVKKSIRYTNSIIIDRGMTLNKKLLATISIIITMTLWGLSYLSTKIALETIHPMTLAFIRFFIASVIMGILLKILEPTSKLKKKDVPRLAACGILSITLYYTFENNGIQYAGSALSSVIIATIPIFSMLGDAWLNKRRLSPKKVSAAIVSLVGVALVMNLMRGALSQDARLGCVIMFGAVFCWVFFNILVEPLYERYSRLEITTYQMWFGCLFLLPFAAIHPPAADAFQPMIIGSVLFLALGCSALGYFLYVAALQTLSITTTTLFINLIPVVAVVSSAIILNDYLNVYQILGGILIIGSVFLSTIERRKSKSDPI
jgi:drug/metabolite transporter (DMT)-like permease